jgi:hypothetical protein
MFDYDDPIFGEAIDLFKEEIAPGLLARLNKKYGPVPETLVFAEFLGKQSFAGQHVQDDPKTLKVFDVNLYKKGLLSPYDFAEISNHGPYYADLITKAVIDDQFINKVKEGRYNDDENPEGVICKWGSGHDLNMMKIKTDAYLRKLRTQFGEDWKKYE